MKLKSKFGDISVKCCTCDIDSDSDDDKRVSILHSDLIMIISHCNLNGIAMLYGRSIITSAISSPLKRLLKKKKKPVCKINEISVDASHLTTGTSIPVDGELKHDEPEIKSEILEPSIKNGLQEDDPKIDSFSLIAKFKCADCNFQSIYKRNLAEHRKTMHIENKPILECSIEGVSKTKDSTEGLPSDKTDSPSVDVKKYKCNTCSFESIHKRSLTEHRKTIHTQNRHKGLQCAECTYKTHHKSHFVRHVNGVHLKLLQFSCDECPFRANQKNILESHIKCIHTKTKNFSCDLCTFKTKTKPRLKNHIKAIHPESLPDTGRSQQSNRSKQYQCEKCPYNSFHKTNFLVHGKNVHEDAKELYCKLCDFTTHLVFAMKEHRESIHQHEFRYKCNRCTYRTEAKDKYTRHLNGVHLKINSLKCQQCDYATNWKSSLKRHIKITHLKLKPFHCPYCDHKSSENSSLQYHIVGIHNKMDWNPV